MSDSSATAYGKLFARDAHILRGQIELARPVLERIWRIQRGRWLMLGAVLLAAMIGLTGASSWLSRTQVATPGGVIDFPVVSRQGVPEDIRLQLVPQGDEAKLRLSQEFLDAWQVEAMQPPPASTSTGPTGVSYFFKTIPGITADVKLSLKARHSGTYYVAMALGADQPRVYGFVVLP